MGDDPDLKAGLRSFGHCSTFGQGWWNGGMAAGVTIQICAVIRKNVEPSRVNGICPLCSHRLPSDTRYGEWVEWYVFKNELFHWYRCF